MRDAIGEDIEPRLRGMLQGHAEATNPHIPVAASAGDATAPKRPPRAKTTE
jgi:hypothetical protein